MILVFGFFYKVLEVKYTIKQEKGCLQAVVHPK